MTTPSERLAIAQRFAAALDRCDFAEALGCLSPACRYELGAQLLIGPDAIIASYQGSAEWGRRVLDQVVYASDVQPDGDAFTVLYTDRITHRGETLEYRSRQRLWLDDAGHVIKIVHEELPGERAQLDDFFSRLGVRR